MDSKINLIDDLNDKLTRVTSMTEVLYAAMESDSYPVEVNDMKGTVWALKRLLDDAQQSFQQVAKLSESNYSAFFVAPRK